MRSLWQFISRYSILLLFVALEVLSLILLTHNNQYQRSVILSSANIVTAKLYEVNNNVVDYFRLGQKNKQLLEENTLLREMLALREESAIDSLPIVPYDLTQSSTYKIIAADIINLSTNQQRNYLTINRGRADGIGVDMGVIGSNGVVGVVNSVSEHFAVIIPILNPAMFVSCRFKRTQDVGSLHWDGLDYRYANLQDIARHIEVKEGDTLITSGLSAVFPADIPVGIVEQAQLTESDAYYRIKVKLATDFRKLRYVYVIRNNKIEEEKELERSIE